MISELKVKKLKENAKLPSRGTQGSAGMDLYACIDAPVTVKHKDLVMIPTGISIELPSPQYAAFLYARSGLGVKHGICLSNGVGVVDSDYRGEICVGLCNLSGRDYTITPNERIAQMVIAPVCPVQIQEVTDISDTFRGSGGFGSTGRE